MSEKLSKKESLFRKIVWDFYQENGRAHLPWRNTQDPYKILVSELMLQQTQVDRVLPKYEAFIKKWPTSSSLAQASLGEVISQWQGLGYNRRAKFLWETVRFVQTEFQGTLPKTEEMLRTLPGIGPYTARAVLAFAYNMPVLLVETNVRQVFIHHFFTEDDVVDDTEIVKLVEKTLPKNDSRNWYAALMDYGSYLKKQHGNVTRRSTTYKKQTSFVGSNRQVRGAILRLLSDGQWQTKALINKLQFEESQIEAQIEALHKEGLVKRKEGAIFLPI